VGESRCIIRSFIVFYSLPDIIRVVKSKRMRSAGNVARMGEMRNIYCILVGKPGEKRPLGRVDIDGKVIVNQFLKEIDVRIWIGFIWIRIGFSGGLL
jgi:hypothetical protein